MKISAPGELQLTDVEGSLLSRETVQLSPSEAQTLRAAARLLRTKRFRMTVRCDACFEDGRGDGMRGAISTHAIDLECRCRFIRYQGPTS
jgi:hypothetical protein